MESALVLLVEIGVRTVALAKLRRIFVGISSVLIGGAGPVSDLTQSVALGKWLVRHIFEDFRHRTRTPSRWIVLNRWRAETRHFGDCDGDGGDLSYESQLRINVF